MKFRRYCIGVLLVLSQFLISHAKDADWKEKFPPGSKAEGSLVKDESDRPYYADHYARRLKETRYPDIALRSADRFYDSVPFEKRSPHRDKIRVNFIHGYFAGFTDPTASMTGGELGGAAGFDAGQEYRRKNPEQLTDVMKSFGYTLIEADGLWTVSFEHSGFRPKGTKEDAEWWLSDVGESDSGLPKDFQVPENGIFVTIQGYLSAEGRYGHLGSYKHEVFVRRFSIKNTDH
jgi:hypothetical protein